MIDTDKYEGTWKFYGMDYWKHWYKGSCEADTNLIHDAPLLLAEVKRLHEENKLMVDYFRFMRDGGFTDADWRTVNEWIGEEEE